jgi:hypothetical protein
MIKYARYQGEEDVEALAMRVYRIGDRNSDQLKKAVKQLADANPQLEKMRGLPAGAPIRVPALEGEKRIKDDPFDEARDMLASLTASLRKALKNAEREVQKRNEILKQPEVIRALEEAQLGARAEAARVEAEEHAKKMKTVEARAAKAVERLSAQMEELAARRRPR